MKIVTVVGARPQFIKAAPVSRALRLAGHHEILLHTGQHYDHGMSRIFFEELGISEPDVNIGVGSGSHGRQTGQMLEKIEEVLIKERPDWVLVYGDTNSTLAGALAASKLHIKIAHVEAGLRSFNRAMPEEVNRVVTDHLSGLLFCPGQTAVDNLSREGIVRGVHIVGDVMADSLAYASERVNDSSGVLSRYELTKGRYLLATIHRPENTDHPGRLEGIMEALNALSETVLFPVHPRTLKVMKETGGVLSRHVKLAEPMGYLDMVALEKSARMILTDSGGIQKEAYWLSVPCITLRDETEWVETVQTGWNILTGADKEKIVHAVESFEQPSSHPLLYTDGHSASKRISILLSERSA